MYLNVNVVIQNEETMNNSKTSNRVRLTLDLSKDLHKELDKIGAETGKSKSELMRLAIDFLLRAQDAKEDNMHVGAWKEDKEQNSRIEREFIGL